MDLTNQPREILSGNDNIVIVDNFQSIRGGRTLDVAGFEKDVIPAGTVIIQDDATKKYKPAPITGEAYGTIPEDHTIKGILIASIPTSRAFAGIMVRGTVNVNAMPFGLAENATLLESVKTALPLVDFTHDKA